MNQSDIAILIFTLVAFAVMLLACVWKTRSRSTPTPDEVPLRIKVIDDNYEPKKPPTPIEELLRDSNKQREPIHYGEAVTAPVSNVQSRAPKILQEQIDIKEDAKVMDKVEAKKKLLWLYQRWKNRRDFKKSVAMWKAQVAARKKLLATGKMGSLHFGITDDMEVKTVSPGGAADSAGIKPGDLLALIKREGRAGNEVCVPMPGKTDFLRALGPQSEVFEGSQVVVVVIRDPEEKRTWAADVAEIGTLKVGTVTYRDAWLAKLKNKKVMEFKVTVGQMTEGAKKSMKKNLEKKKAEHNITLLNVELVMDFLSDPVKCAAFVKKVFDNADKDKSGELDEAEIHNVFTQMTEVTDVDPPSRADTQKLFSLMDESYDRKLTFDEFFPYFRTKMVRLIMEKVIPE